MITVAVVWQQNVRQTDRQTDVYDSNSPNITFDCCCAGPSGRAV